MVTLHSHLLLDVVPECVRIQVEVGGSGGPVVEGAHEGGPGGGHGGGQRRRGHGGAGVAGLRGRGGRG